MDYHLVRAALIIVAFVAFYAVIARGLFKLTEVHRWNALEIAEKLNHSAQVSDHAKLIIRDRLTEVYSHWRAWQLVGLVICVAVMLPFRRRANDGKLAEGVPAHFRWDYERFTKDWIVSTLGNSPLATFMFATVTLFIVAFSLSISALVGALAFHRDHHDGAEVI
jgi:hypothetical protein